MRAIPSILVIDDNTEALDTISSLLSIVGAESVRQAKSAEQAFEMLENQSFAIILSDYQMEGMDGIDFLDKLRSKGNQTPVLLLSGALDKAAVLRASRYSKVDIFAKPFQMTDLLSAVERLTEEEPVVSSQWSVARPTTNYEPLPTNCAAATVQSDTGPPRPVNDESGPS